MRKRALSLAVAIIGCFALVSASGAATTKTQRGSKVDISTRAAVVHYLRSIHVNPKGAVIERGRLNYAGARCPGKGWTCTGTKHTVVQIAKRGGQNRFACGTAKCVVAQFASVSNGLHAAGHALSSTPPTPVNTASCIKTTGVAQSCTINQPNATGTNRAVVWMDTGKLTGLAQSAVYTASIAQGPASAGNSTNWNFACVHQAVSITGSTTTNGASATVTSDAHQSITIQQNSLHGNNAVQGAVPSGKSYTCNSDATSPLTQDESLTSVVTGKGSITQKQDTMTNGSANVVVDVEQNQKSGFKGSATGVNSAAFTQSSDMEAVANTPKGPVIQTQSSLVPNPPYSGLVGTINQDSSNVSTASATQTETQCEDAVNTSLPHSAAQSTCDTNDADAPTGISLTQTQFGPEGVFTPPTKSAGRVPFVHKGYGMSTQTGNPGGGDMFTLHQNSTQNTDHGPHSSQSNLVQGDCQSTGGACEAGQTTTVNGDQTQDGWTAPTIGNININCQPNQNNGQCVPTPPPTPTFVSGPSDPNPSSSAAFNFTDPATGGVHFLCKIDGTPHTCVSGVAFFQGYGPHTFQVAAADNHGNVSAYVPTTAFSWENVPPDPTIDTKPLNPAGYGSSSFTFSDTDPTVHFQCQIGSDTPTACNSGSITYSGATVLSSGPHMFSVRAYDSTDTVPSVNAATYNWVITPPDPTITASSEPTDPDFAGNSYTFAFTDADPTVHYLCQIDSDAATSCNTGNSPTYSGLAPGSHMFSVTAYDQSDTYPSNNPTTFTWTILPLEVSALGGTDESSAGWACQAGGPIALTVGSAPYDPPSSPGTFAQITLDDAGGTSIDGLSEPTFTTDNYAAGSPRFVIDLSNGDSLWGYPPNAGLNGTDFAWATNNGNTYQPWSVVQSVETGTTVVDAFVIADGDQVAGTTDNIGSLQFNGTTYNSGTCT